MKAIYKRELRSYFTSMIGCAFAAVLTVIGGVYFMVYNLTSGYPLFFLFAVRRHLCRSDHGPGSVHEMLCGRKKK